MNTIQVTTSEQGGVVRDPLVVKYTLLLDVSKESKSCIFIVVVIPGSATALRADIILL